jgi:hypothetical protein
MSESAAALTDNGFLPAGILTVPQSSRENLDSLAEGLAAKHGGARNMHRVAVVSGQVTFTGLSLPADDLQFVQQRELSTREVARIFGVPVWMIGGSTGDSLTYSTDPRRRRQESRRPRSRRQTLAGRRPGRVRTRARAWQATVARGDCGGEPIRAALRQPERPVVEHIRPDEQRQEVRRGAPTDTRRALRRGTRTVSRTTRIRRTQAHLRTPTRTERA